jgi:hypothetical protein
MPLGLELVGALVLVSGQMSAPSCLPGTGTTPDRIARYQHFARIARAVNALQREHREATKRYATREDLEGPSMRVSRDGDHVIGGLTFDRPENGSEMRLTTDTNSYTRSIKDVSDPCGFALFTDQNRVIYAAQPMR